MNQVSIICFSIIVIELFFIPYFHLLNGCFTFFSDTHYFREYTNLFRCVEENNPGDWVIDAGDYRKSFTCHFGNEIVKLCDGHSISDMMYTTSGIFINVILKYATS